MRLFFQSPRHRNVEFQISGSRDTGRIGPANDQPFSIYGTLSGCMTDRAQRFAGQHTKPPVGVDRLSGHSGVGDDDGNISFAGLAIQVGPELGFHDDEQARLKPVEKPVNGAR